MNDVRMGASALMIIMSSRCAWPSGRNWILNTFVHAGLCLSLRERFDLVLVGPGVRNCCGGASTKSLTALKGDCQLELQASWFQSFPFQFVVETGVLLSCASSLVLTLPFIQLQLLLESEAKSPKTTVTFIHSAVNECSWRWNAAAWMGRGKGLWGGCCDCVQGQTVLYGVVLYWSSPALG